jgi:putative ABC transport system ATP-binding protein
VVVLAELRQDRVGFVFQNYHLIPTLTVCENVMLPLAPRLGLALAARVRALHCIERVGLENRIHHLPKELSGGEQQRAALARALVMRPALVLADEPTGNLDPANAAAVLELLLGLMRTDGMTVLLSTHSPEVASRCARQVRLEQGRVVAVSG